MEYPKYNAAARAEVFKLLQDIEELFDKFADMDTVTTSTDPIHKSWLEGRSSGYKLVADHLRRIKAMYGSEEA